MDFFQSEYKILSGLLKPPHLRYIMTGGLMEEPGLHLGEALDPWASSPHWQPQWNTNVGVATRHCPESYGSRIQSTSTAIGQ